VDSLSQQIQLLSVSKDYYATSIEMQTGIFSVIVAAILVGIGFLVYLRIKDFVHDRFLPVTERMQQWKNEMPILVEKEIETKLESHRAEFTSEFARHSFQLKSIQRDAARAMALVPNGRPEDASLWWSMAAKLAYETEESDICKISLNFCLEQLKKVPQYGISSEMVVSIREDLSGISDTTYVIEKTALLKELDRRVSGV